MPNNAPRWLAIAGVIGLLWNSIGLWAYLGHVGLAPAMAPLPEVPMPMPVHAGFAVGVFAALIGCVGLIIRQRWARPVLWLSLAGLIIDWGWVFGWSGQGVTPLGVTVLVTGLALALLGEHATRRGWLR